MGVIETAHFGRQRQRWMGDVVSEDCERWLGGGCWVVVRRCWEADARRWGEWGGVGSNFQHGWLAPVWLVHRVVGQDSVECMRLKTRKYQWKSLKTDAYDCSLRGNTDDQRISSRHAERESLPHINYELPNQSWRPDEWETGRLSRTT